MSIKEKGLVYGSLAGVWIAGIISNLIYWSTL